MGWNRHHFYAAGIIILAIGIQIHLVKSYVLTSQATTFLAKHMDKLPVEQPQNFGTFLAASGPRPDVKKEISPPNWLGWAMISFGSVLILHSWAMPKPG